VDVDPSRKASSTQLIGGWFPSTLAYPADDARAM
jgi:hypothetical protein